MVLAPLAALPLGGLVALICLAGGRLGLHPLAVAVTAIALLALGSRALHWDGLSDTADGLTASYDAERSLAVMKSGTSGPAGVVATVAIFGLQVAGLASLLLTDGGWLTAGVLVCLSRCALVLLCSRGVPGARSDGLGATFVGTVPRSVAVATWALALLLAWLVGGIAALVGVVCAAAVVLLLIRRVVTRFGGVTGDVFGAAIEIALATMLLTVS